MKYLMALGLVALAAGCSGKEANEVPDTQQGAYSEVVVRWQGRDLHCVRFDTGNYHSDDSGLSCDWVAFHKDDPR